MDTLRGESMASRMRQSVGLRAEAWLGGLAIIHNSLGGALVRRSAVGYRMWRWAESACSATIIERG